ncbi:delta(1)-pyrroline-2-carboxylate reductase family protein [Aquincola sp. S2]|uniref:Delta(1)-pyrroline-2-carboxylate reductase family protein n=1 Tax=Pseudaquabacterium terrae TaxID=2732868 RepID=A0ABX2ELT4_9BURK|nr:delta(1)-pyrroline-2-carboxylate reductase family protein [Aquabacterium terrae]NRF69563.1 delta(1)-pyrroline-2-carboxylate reductase family protein [Aquabacterium terrae]
MMVYDAAATARALPWAPLVHAIERTLLDLAQGQVQAPERWVLPLATDTSWFLMPAWLSASAGDLAAIKLITYAAANPERGLPAILGDVLVVRASTGERLALLDGPTVTARRTAAVTLYAAHRLAPRPVGPLLVIGTGVQALAHVAAFTEALGVDEVWVSGRTPASGRAFTQTLHQHGLFAEVATDLDAALQRCPMIVTCTPAQAVCLRGTVRDDAFVAAIGAFTPAMIELDPALTRDIAERGQVVIDSAAARHEAGDLIAAGLTLTDCATLAEQPARQDRGPVLFKSCGSALWDLAAARCVAESPRLPTF